MKRTTVSYNLIIIAIVAIFLMSLSLPAAGQEAATDSVCWPNIWDPNDPPITEEDIAAYAPYAYGNVTGDSMTVYQEGTPEGVTLESDPGGTYLRRDGSWGIGGNAAADPDSGLRVARMSWQKEAIYPGETAVGWPLNNDDILENVYVQFKASPMPGYNFIASSISFDIGALDDYMYAKAFVSTDPTFADSTEIWYSDGLLVDTDFDYIETNVDITANSDESVYLRIYVWGDSLTEYEARGRVVLKSTFQGEVKLGISKIVVDEIHLIGSRCGPFAKAIEVLEKKLVDVIEMIDGDFPLDRAKEAFALAQKPEIMKVLITPWSKGGRKEED